MSDKREVVLLVCGLILLVLSFLALIMLGAVSIPIEEVFDTLFGKGDESSYIRTIVIQSRVPMAIAAACCGMTLSVAGLVMQTVFHNPLAGPSVLGISSGASFGVATLMLGAGGLWGVMMSEWQPVMTTLGAIGGSMMIIIILFIFSSSIKSGVSLLIVGLMISYLCSSGISLLNYFSPADEIRNYLVWGLGSFNSLRLSAAVWLLTLSIASLLPLLFYIKPLNALLLGERYLESVGYSVRNIRGGLLIVTGCLVAIPTAFCGPIGFIGLIVPHLCRLLFKTSNHQQLLPACVVYGALVSLICALLGVIPSASFGVLPINVITPVIGVPVILYLLVNRKRLPYFS